MGSDTDHTIITGHWYPPRASRAVEAGLSIGTNNAVVRSVDGEAKLTECPVSRLSVSDRVGRIPRRITFADGSIFETEENDTVDVWLEAHSRWRAGRIHRLEKFHPRLIVLVAIIAVLCVGLYRFAMPLAVEAAVALTPSVAPRLIGESALASLDKTVLHPSALSKQRQKEIAADFRALAAHAPGGADAFRLEFRGGGQIGPNAFALPDGTIILTDELVELVDHEDAIMGVLGHEIGHVVHKHTLRRLYHAAGTTAMIMFISGDIGSGMEDVLVQTSGLATLSYSRGQESDADRYSINLMAKAGREPAGLARLFEALRDEYGDDGEKDFFSTHPATPERIEAIRRHAAELTAVDSDATRQR